MLLTSVETMFSSLFMTDDSEALLFDNLGFRVTVAYEDGTLFSVLPNNSYFLTHSDDKIDKSPGSNWIWQNGSHGYLSTFSCDDKDQLMELVSELREEHGVPKIVLPWNEFIDAAIDEAGIDENSELDEDTACELFMLAIQNLGNSTSDDHDFEVCDRTQYLNSLCAIKRYWSLENELLSRGWVIFAECCSNCLVSAKEELYSVDPTKKSAPELILWTQNAGFYSTPTGDFKYTFTNYALDDAQINLMIELANNFDFIVSKTTEGLELVSN